MSRIVHNSALALICAVAVSVLSCNDEVTPPVPLPGDLVVTLVSPNGPEAAVVLETTDEGIDGIQSLTGEAHHWRAGDVSRIVVLLEEPGEIRFALSLADVNRAPALQILEVADPDNRLRDDLSEYELETAVVEPQVLLR